jgi:KDO2-lipid IV(A) lauroyltransferase
MKIAVESVLATARKIPQTHNFIVSGRFTGPVGRPFMGMDIGPGGSNRPKVLGIIGFGRIGRAVMKRSKGFRMKVIAYDPPLKEIIEKTRGANIVSFTTFSKPELFENMRRLRQRLLRWIIYRGLTLIIVCFRTIPMRIGLLIGEFLGGLAYFVLGRDRRLALENLSMAFDDKDASELRNIVKDMFRNFGRGLVEVINIPALKAHITDIVTIQGLEHVDKALKGNKGLLWITGHIGNWELMPVTFAQIGYGVNVVARPLYDARINMLLDNMRAESNIKTIARGDRSSMREIFRVLKRNELLGLLIDQDTKVPGVFVDFFKRKAFTPRGAAEIALRTGCPVVAGFIHRTEDGKHKIVIYPQITIDRTGR